MGFWSTLACILSGHIPSKGYKPYVDSRGVIHALSGTEADQLVQGTTPAGRKSRAVVRTGYDTYQARDMEWDALNPNPAEEAETQLTDEQYRYIYGETE